MGAHRGLTRLEFLEALRYYRDAMLNYYLFLDVVRSHFQARTGRGKVFGVLDKLQLTGFLLMKKTLFYFEDPEYQPYEDVCEMIKMRDKIYEAAKRSRMESQ